MLYLNTDAQMIKQTNQECWCGIIIKTESYFHILVSKTRKYNRMFWRFHLFNTHKAPWRLPQLPVFPPSSIKSMEQDMSPCSCRDSHLAAGADVRLRRSIVCHWMSPLPPHPLPVTCCCEDSDVTQGNQQQKDLTNTSSSDVERRRRMALSAAPAVKQTKGSQSDDKIHVSH